MKLLFLACLTPRSGNYTTAARLREYIEAAGHNCCLRDVADFKTPEEVTHLILEEEFDGCLAIHLYKGGRLLLGTSAPFGVVLGGTDINEDVKHEVKREVMGKVLQKARFAVAFSSELKESAATFWPFHRNKIYVQAQGIEAKDCPSFKMSEFLQSTGLTSNHFEDLHIFLLVCGMRRVKDPLYLVKVFSEWHLEDPSVYLIIIGPEIDPAFTEEVASSVKRANGVLLASERPQGELQAAMKTSFALVNSSISEGMSAAVLEAMNLNVPVLARNIPGNASIVKHEETGLLFSSPQEFIQLSKKLMQDASLRQRLVLNAKAYVTERHSTDMERLTYQQLIHLLK
ncbi:glycosyltransferase 1 domain-containing protein 1 isoform X1 [Erpetoichthys calabaricus]|uniref:Glycosyltransferase 1 domain containing 1 n=1 Tax=Erpetoichthys calabaricus TaxID=27687 RepID=A0A8C4TBD6_ERPCA|nr:glycosyltransferase 1 domain-containing protein 1 isoform X1 [Erpetoichthys calabaricus]